MAKGLFIDLGIDLFCNDNWKSHEMKSGLKEIEHKRDVMQRQRQLIGKQKNVNHDLWA